MNIKVPVWACILIKYLALWSVALVIALVVTAIREHYSPSISLKMNDWVCETSLHTSKDINMRPFLSGSWTTTQCMQWVRKPLENKK